MYYQNNSFAEGYAIGRDSNNNNNYGSGFGFGGDNAWWIVILLIFGNGGYGGWNRNGAAEAALTRGELCQDMNFNNLESGVRGIQQGLCDGFYAMNNSVNAVGGKVSEEAARLQNFMNQGFYGLNQGQITQGYENRMAVQGLGDQIARCCCDILGGIKDTTTQGIMNTNAIQQQISQCCCENEKLQLQTKYETARDHCETLRAIDDLGDRMINFWNAKETQQLRDENLFLKLERNNDCQTRNIVQTLNPQVVPSFSVPAPWNYGGCCNNSRQCC